MAEDSQQHVLDQMEIYLTDGLTPGERLAFEAHAAECPVCAAAMAEAREADARLREMFREMSPDQGFEDRIITRLRLARLPRWTILHPMALRATAAAAAAVVLVGTGAMVSHALDREGIDAVALAASPMQRSMQAPTLASPHTANTDVTQMIEGERSGDGVADIGLGAQGNMGRNVATAHATRDSAAPANPSLAYAATKPPGQEGFQPTRQLPALTEQVQKDKAAGNTLPSFFLVAKTQDLAPTVFNAPPSSAAPDPFQHGQSSAPLTAQTNPAPINSRKIIRNGTMEFEVARFDDALTRITKLVVDQGGFVATTDSDKLPNGKMKGTITLRLPPEHLDTLVLMLRGIGDLKSQKIGAQDVTRHYTDLESQLRAARAMEERLLDIVKTGKGQIKDLLLAEKELAVWREKIEQIEGEKRYLDNQVSLSTLTLELYERDIRTPALASQSEQVQMSLETEKVAEAFDKARAAIDAAKGRILQSELKQYDAGQFGATIQAAIPPDAAEQVIARLRQLPGRIAHFSRDSRRTTANGEAPLAGVTTVQREDVVVSMQIYNLANVAPRRTTSLQLAVPNVDLAYGHVLDQVRSAGGRIVSSSLTKPDANQQVAAVEFQVPAEKSDGVADGVRGLGEVMRQETTENPDTDNVTETKRGFHLRIVSMASVPARESQDVRLAATNVRQAFASILASVNAAGGRVLESGLNEQDPQDVTAAVSYEIPRAATAALDAAMNKAAQVLSRTIKSSSDTQNTLDSKIGVSLSLSSAERLPPRESATIRQEVPDVQRAADDLIHAAAIAGGRRIGNGRIDQDRAGHSTAEIVVDVPLTQAAGLLDQLEKSGDVRSRQSAFDNTVPDGPLARARIDVTFANSAESLGGEQSAWDAVRHALGIAALGLRWSLQMLVIGACFVAPWALILWGGWRIMRRRRRRVRGAA